MKGFFKNVKRIAAGVLASSVLLTGAVFAEDADALLINGSVVEEAQVLNVGEKTFVPVRALCEALGMDVQWDAESNVVTVSKGVLYVTFLPDADGYTFAKTAPMQLGSAPFLKDCRTYVPVNFIDEILKLEYAVSENGDIDVAAVVDNSVGAIVKEVNSEEEGLSILVADSRRNEDVVVNITEETVITDADGKALTAEDLVVNAEIKVEYADFMTMSIPPITNAVKIQVLGVIEEEAQEAEEAVVTVLEKKTEDGVTAITVFDPERNEDVVVTVSEETVVTDPEGNAVALDTITVGTDVVVQYADFMTMSIPPITNAVKIQISESKETSTVFAVDTEAKTITVFDKEMKSVLVLNITDETVLKNAEGNEIKFEDIKRGTELVSYEHAEAMTRSIPPITNATSVVAK